MKKLKIREPWNGFVYCIYAGKEQKHFTEEKVYRVINGRVFTDTGIASCKKFKSLDDFNNNMIQDGDVKGIFLNCKGGDFF